MLWILIATALVPPLSAQQWEFRTVGPGAKPDLALGPDGSLHVAYMLEADLGWVRHALWNEDAASFDIQEVSAGYFYGPLALTVSPQNIPHILYHDHGAADQVHASLVDGIWTHTPIVSDGHDGWDNDVVVDELGNVHTSSVDPSGFGGVGVEYALFNGADWRVEPVGSSSIMYANGTSIQLSADRSPRISFFDDTSLDLMLAERKRGVWEIAAVDTSGDVGRFASLQIDSDDRSHLSYYQHLDNGTGLVKYAESTDSGWDISVVDTLFHVVLGHTGARNLTSLALDSEGQPHIAYADQRVLRYARRAAGGWVLETVYDVPQGEPLLGQQTSLALGADGTPYLACFEVTSASPLNGIIRVATRASSTAIESPVDWSPDLSVFPNPSEGTIEVHYGLGAPLPATLSVYDSLGREVIGPLREESSGELSSRQIDLSGSAPGSYFVILRVNGRSFTTPIIVAR